MDNTTWVETIEQKVKTSLIDGYIGYVPKEGSLFRIYTKNGRYFANLILPFGIYVNIFDFTKPKAKRLLVKEIESIVTF